MRVAGIDLSGMMGSIAAKLAHQDNTAQAEFLNVFFKELRSACGDTTFDARMQCRWIQDKLDENAAELLQHMVPVEGES